MNATTLYNIKISKSGVKLKTISTGLMAEISVYDLDDKETYVIYCYKELAEKVSRMKLQPREFIIASGKMEYIPIGDNFMKVLKATSVEYCKASAKPDAVAVESSNPTVVPAPTQVAAVQPVQPPVKPVQAEPQKQNSSNSEEINLDEVDIFADMLLSADEL
mgnify:FL=1